MHTQVDHAAATAEGDGLGKGTVRAAVALTGTHVFQVTDGTTFDDLEGAI